MMRAEELPESLPMEHRMAYARLRHHVLHVKSRSGRQSAAMWKALLLPMTEGQGWPNREQVEVAMVSLRSEVLTRGRYRTWLLAEALAVLLGGYYKEQAASTETDEQTHAEECEWLTAYGQTAEEFASAVEGDIMLVPESAGVLRSAALRASQEAQSPMDDLSAMFAAVAYWLSDGVSQSHAQWPNPELMAVLIDRLSLVRSSWGDRDAWLLARSMETACWEAALVAEVMAEPPAAHPDARIDAETLDILARHAEKFAREGAF